MEMQIDRPPLRSVPINPVLPVVNDVEQLSNAISELSQGVGSIAVDAERASGYRYLQRAYLIQLFRTGAPIVLIDPIDLDLTELQLFLNQQPWILHAATQDLPCLNELGLYPPQLFDTELAAKLLGMPKVGLATLTETLLNVSLAKEHSAVNWSIRPLQTDWLNYAALDVELLPELKTKLEQELTTTERITWATQEFEKLKNFKPNPPRADQWRRTSGMHELPSRRQKAIVEQLWLARDSVASKIDIAPGRLINDRILIAIAKSAVGRPVDLDQIKKYVRGPALEYAELWLNAVTTAINLDESALPRSVKREDIIPNPRSWEDLNPAAHQRWAKYRSAANEVAAELGISPEVLISPDSLKKYCWDDLELTAESEIELKLLELGNRGWSAKILASKFAELNL